MSFFICCRNETAETRQSLSTSRSPSPTRPLSDSQRDELVTLRQKCEQLEKQLQDERKLVIDKKFKCLVMIVGVDDCIGILCGQICSYHLYFSNKLFAMPPVK